MSEEEENERQRKKQEILEFKKRVQNLNQELQVQKEDWKIKKSDEDKRSKSTTSKSNKFSSFDAAINRKPFMTLIHKDELFNMEKDIFFDIGQYKEDREKQKLIMPTRVNDKSVKKLDYQIDHPTSKLKSDFPILKDKQMSQKEIERMNYWNQLYEYNLQEQIKDQTRFLVGSTKKMAIEDYLKQQKYFFPQKVPLDYFEQKPSLISEKPLTPRKVTKMISLPRVYDQKVWIPNNNYY